MDRLSAIAEMIAVANDLDARGDSRRAGVVDKMIKTAIQLGKFFPPEMVPPGTTFDEPAEDLRPAVLDPGDRRYDDVENETYVDGEAAERYVKEQIAFYVSKGMSPEEAKKMAYKDLFDSEDYGEDAL